MSRALVLPLVLLLFALAAASACGEPAPAPAPTAAAPAAPAPTGIAPPGTAPPGTPPALPPTPAIVAQAPPVVATVPSPTPKPTSAPTPVLAAAPTPSPTSTPVPPPVAKPFLYSVTDSDGKRVTFTEPPKRIVAYSSASVEALFAIGEGKRVVATHSFVGYPPEVASIPKVGDAFNMNIEAVVALQPDLVFIDYRASFFDKLEKTGLKILYVKSLDDNFLKTADNIRMWGGITGSTSAAEALASRFEARVNRIKEIMAPYASDLSVFQDVGGLWTPGPNTLVGEVFQLLKVRNIAFDVAGYAQLSPEVIVDRNPQIILTDDALAFTGNPAFRNVQAVRNNRVLSPDSNLLSIAGPRFVDGIEELARLIYPPLFKDLGSAP